MSGCSEALGILVLFFRNIESQKRTADLIAQTKTIKHIVSKRGSLYVKGEPLLSDILTQNQATAIHHTDAQSAAKRHTLSNTKLAYALYGTFNRGTLNCLPHDGHSTSD